MRRLALLPACLLLLLLLAHGAAAQDDDEEPSAVQEYFSETGSRALAGINGMITWPADPVMFTVEGQEVFEGATPPAGYPLGFLAGTLQGIYRLTMGTLDLVFAPLTAMPVLGPLPRYKAFPFEHPNE